MKPLYVLVLLLIALSSHAFECLPFGPAADIIYSANFHQEPWTIGGIANQQSLIYIQDADTWHAYPFWATNFPILGSCKLDHNTMMVAMGCGSFSDGVYNFNLESHIWTVNEWFMRPNFILKCASNDIYYVGERDGLFKSSDGISWFRIAAIGMGECNSFAYSADHLVTNRGPYVYYSSDAGLSWQQANTGNLRGFRFSSGGDLLYAFMAVGSDSDGLWRSLDQGATWNPVLYTSHLSGIGPDFGGHFALGWSQANENGNFLEFLQPDLQLSPLIHPDLNSPVRQIEIFPLVNTPSFYVINSGGIFYLTGFIVSAPDEDIPSPNVRNPILYPNPANKEIFLKFDPPSAHDLRLSLYDLKGRRIASYAGLSAEAGLLRQSLPELPSGMYLLRVYKDSQIYTRKLLIRN